MAFPKNLLNDHEELVLDLRPHWFFLFEPTISLVGAILLGLIVKSLGYTFTNYTAAALILGVLVWFLFRYLTWLTTNFVVTSHRVVFRKGIIAKHGVEIPLDRINTVFFNQSVFERMIGAGDLGIESAGEGGQETFSDVRKPSIVQNEIYRQMEHTTQRTFGTMRASAVGHVELSIPEQLEKLDDLRRRGVINDQEFAAKKAQLLDRM